MSSRFVPVVLVLLLAPVTAEYLIGYDDIIGSPGTLLFGIIFFAPLYGAPAVLIRELARRRDAGWPAILLMATAFGLVQAGLVDQSLFDPSYRDISYWDSLRDPTFLGPLGTSAYMLVTFVGGHVLGSMAAPIALAESWQADRHTPWLRTRGLWVMGALWAAGSAFVLGDQLGSTSARITWGQGLGTAAVAVLLVVVALNLSAHPARSGSVPPPWVVLLGGTALLVMRNVVLTGWPSTLVAAGSIAAALVLLGRWGRSPQWTGVHAVAAVTAVLLSIGVPAFFTDPLGDVPLVQQLVTNATLLLLVLAVAARGLVVQRRPTLVT